MSGEKKFGSAAFGFSKADVNAYIEKMVHEFDQRLKEKDDEISNLKLQIREMKTRYESIAQESENLAKDKERIAGALIKAQEKADAIIQEARARAEEEKIKLDQELERERERIIDIKRDVKAIKMQVVEMLSKFQALLNENEAYIESKEMEYNDRDEEAC
ncbi:MAG: hypothetical protein GXX10_04370 [Clostridiaceae bacterium]|nr:hypothetical protein [Clostridiaceae bacterium]